MPQIARAVFASLPGNAILILTPCFLQWMIWIRWLMTWKPSRKSRSRTLKQIDPPPILVDTREPDPHLWEQYFSVPIIRRTLPTGDFSLPGCEEWICIERKELNDLINCLCSERDRFTRELQRAARIKSFYVICEGSYEDLLRGNYRSDMNPKAAWESVLALQHRFDIPFLMAGNIQVAARLCESILMRWWKEHAKLLEQVRIAARRALRTGSSQAAQHEITHL
jgi:ERCC4-type nuclease